MSRKCHVLEWGDMLFFIKHYFEGAMMSEDRNNPAYVEKLANSAAVSGAVNGINSHRHGFVPPVQTTVFTPNFAGNGSGLTNAPLVAKAQTVGQSIGTPGQGMEMQIGSGAMHQAMLDAQAVEEAARRTKTVQLGMDVATDKGKDSKGKDGASADAPAAEKAADAPAINAAVLSNLVEKDTRSRINEATGQTSDQQQPSQQQDAKKSAEKANENAALAPAKKGKGLAGLDKATADSVNNGSLGALSKGKGDKEKDKPKVATVSNSSLPKPPATPPRPQPPAGHRAPSAPKGR